MDRPTFLDDMHRAELVSSGPIPVLTDKGRAWLRTMEDLQNREVELNEEERAADLILSTSGLSR